MRFPSCLVLIKNQMSRFTLNLAVAAAKSSTTIADDSIVWLLDAALFVAAARTATALATKAGRSVPVEACSAFLTGGADVAFWASTFFKHHGVVPGQCCWGRPCPLGRCWCWYKPCCSCTWLGWVGSQLSAGWIKHASYHREWQPIQCPVDAIRPIPSTEQCTSQFGKIGFGWGWQMPMRFFHSSKWRRCRWNVDRLHLDARRSVAWWKFGLRMMSPEKYRSLLASIRKGNV